MNRRISYFLLCAAVVGLIGATWLFAQTADSLNEGTTLEYDNTNEIWRFKWWGKAGRTYFIQHSEDLALWNWVPVIESGDDSVKEWGFTTDADGFFLRLRHTDIPTTDPESDDFDGDGVPNLFEIMNGFNPFGTTDANDNGMPDEWELFNTGKFAVWPPTLSARLPRNQTATKTIYLRNDTETGVNYTVGLTENMGPSYSFEDSVTGNAVYAWEEISATGTQIDIISLVVHGHQVINLTQFAFPYYGNTFDKIYVRGRGAITMSTTSYPLINTALPSLQVPGNFIAVFWDYLNTFPGEVYFQEESDRLIIQFENLTHLDDASSSYTFQAVLYSDGRISFRYKNMAGILDTATIGIQNSMRTSGLQVAFNTAYVADEMAVDISPQSSFLSVTPSTGTVPAFTTLALDAAFHSLQLPFGTYIATVTASHDAPDVAAPHTATATLEVFNVPAIVALTAPASGTEILQGNSLTLTATATDAEGMAKVEFYNGSTKITEDSSPPYSQTWNNPPVGTHVLTAHAIDIFGGVTVSGPVTVSVLADTDGDGMPDFWEIAHGLDPLVDDASGDLDDDGLSNLWEFLHGFNPNDPSDALRDTSGNGIPDWWEIVYFGSFGDVDAAADPDRDDLSNLQEFQLGTDPTNWDSDGDLLPDGWEVQFGLDPLDDQGSNGTEGDPDDDGLSNYLEWSYGSNPNLADTDGDGTPDGQEVSQGGLPNDASDNGQPPSEDEVLPMRIIIGDPSGSHSERWRVEIRDMASEKLILNHASREFGELSPEAESVFNQFRKGKAYELNLIWVATDPDLLELDPDREFFPDYDWALEVSYKDDDGTWVDVSGDSQNRFIVLDPWDPATKQIAENNVKLLVNQDELEYPWEWQKDRTEQYQNQIESKRVILLPVDMAVDANRDGEIKMGSSSDTTTQEKPFVFWVNDDFDKDNKEEDSGIPDWQDGLIQCTRDLEDFSRIKISVGGLREAFQQGKFKLGFEWKQTTDSPAVQIYPQVEESAGEGYLKDEAVAAAQIEPGIPTGRWAYVAGGGGTLIGTGQAKVFASLPTSIATRDFEEDGMIHLLFEGCGEGKGQLCITIHDENGAKIGDGPGVWLDLKNVKKMYQRVVATPENGFDPPYDYTTPPPEPNVGYNIYAADGNLFQTPPDEEKKAVVFVHGWNMTWNDYHSFSETMFKRLWHKGYKGRFVSFRWPTLAGGLMTHYNTSEHRGWKYGSALKAYVDSLPNDYTKNIAAHSMGNVVAGSALKSGMTITNYALMQAAIPAGCYDTSSTINNYARFLNAEASVPTPDLANPDLGYRGYLSSVSGNLVNFYNADDFALVTGSYPVIGEANWEKNQESYKPDDHPVGPGHYLYDPNAPAGQRGQVTFTLSNGRFVTDPHEMMSFVARPRSKAVGAMTGVGSPVNVGPGSSSNFGDSRSDHSGQFDRRIQELQSFYDSLYDLVR